MKITDITNYALYHITIRNSDNIIMNLGGIVWGVLHWIREAGGRNQKRDLVNTVMNLRVPKGDGYFLE
jgi:hypothetical protein